MDHENENEHNEPVEDGLQPEDAQGVDDTEELGQIAEQAAEHIEDDAQAEESEETEEEAPDDGTESSIAGGAFNHVPQHVVHDRSCESPIADDKKGHPAFMLDFLRHTVSETHDIADKVPNMKLSGGANQVWAFSFTRGLEHLLEGDALTSALSRDESEWNQVIEVGGKRLSPGRPGAVGSNGKGEKVTGDRALYRVYNAIGMGTLFQFPLWHAGIWVTIKAPTDAELLTLDEQLANEKITLGMETSGLIYSNTSVALMSRIVDFALDHVYETTLRDSSKENLRKMIPATDIQTLIWGLSCAIYPGGYPYRRPCIADPEKCQHVQEALLHLPRLAWTDKKSLSNGQKKHMVNRNAKHENAHVISAYQDAHVRGVGQRINIAPGLDALLKVPSIEEYVESGYSWIQSIVDSVEENFGSTLKGAAREKHIERQAFITTMRQYSHWVEALYLTTEDSDEEDDYIDEQEDVEKSLADISGGEEVRTNFFNGIEKFIDDSTISLIGIPRYNCPNCRRPQGEEGSGHDFVIPLDTFQTFFTLRHRRVALAKMIT